MPAGAEVVPAVVLGLGAYVLELAGVASRGGPAGGAGGDEGGGVSAMVPCDGSLLC